MGRICKWVNFNLLAVKLRLHIRNNADYDHILTNFAMIRVIGKLYDIIKHIIFSCSYTPILVSNIERNKRDEER